MPEPAEWLIIGQPMANGDGVVVLAAIPVGDVHVVEGRSMRTGAWAMVDAHIREWEKVQGADYADALRKLFRRWRLPEIEPTRGQGDG